MFSEAQQVVPGLREATRSAAPRYSLLFCLVGITNSPLWAFWFAGDVAYMYEGSPLGGATASMVCVAGMVALVALLVWGIANNLIVRRSRRPDDALLRDLGRLGRWCLRVLIAASAVELLGLALAILLVRYLELSCFAIPAAFSAAAALLVAVDYQRRHGHIFRNLAKLLPR